MAIPGFSSENRAEAVRSRAVALLQTIELAKGLTGNERTIDLTGLDSEIGIVCAQALDLGPEHAGPVVPVLQKLLARLEALAAALRA